MKQEVDQRLIRIAVLIEQLRNQIDELPPIKVPEFVKATLDRAVDDLFTSEEQVIYDESGLATGSTSTRLQKLDLSKVEVVEFDEYGDGAEYRCDVCGEFSLCGTAQLRSGVCADCATRESSRTAARQSSGNHGG